MNFPEISCCDYLGLVVWQLHPIVWHFIELAKTQGYQEKKSPITAKQALKIPELGLFLNVANQRKMKVLDVKLKPLKPSIYQNSFHSLTCKKCDDCRACCCLRGHTKLLVFIWCFNTIHAHDIHKWWPDLSSVEQGILFHLFFEEEQF